MGTPGDDDRRGGWCTGRRLGSEIGDLFETADIVGIDVSVHVVKNIYESVPNDEFARDVTASRCWWKRWCGAAGWGTRQDKILQTREGERRARNSDLG